MKDSKTYRPDFFKPDICSAYYELTGLSIPNGVIQGDGLVRYRWRYFDILEGTTFPYTLVLLEIQIRAVMNGSIWQEAKGLLFQFDVLETGTTTFGELYIDLEDNSTRQVLYDLRSRDVRLTTFTTIEDLMAQLLWMPANFKTNGQTDIAEISLVTYKRFDDNYNG